MANYMKSAYGEKAVTIVKTKTIPIWINNKPKDFTDYENPYISAVIPCWKGDDGVLRSVKTGKVVTIDDNCQERPCSVGTAFRYPDGEEILLTRNGLGEMYFVPKECTTCVMRNAFGE